MPTKTVVTATIQNAAGNLATSGYVEFTLQPKVNSSLYYVLDTGVIAPQTVRATINASGQLKAEDGVSPLELWGNNTLNPTNTWYKARFVPEGQVTNTVDLLLINGTTYDLAAPVFWEPGVVQANRQPIHFQAIESDIIPQADGVYWLGDATHKYAGVYAAQLFADSINFTDLSIAGDMSVGDDLAVVGDATVGGTLAVTGLATLSAGVLMPEISEPSAPAANNGILYVRDNGAGKTQLAIRFPTGAVQVIATEP